MNLDKYFKNDYLELYPQQKEIIQKALEKIYYLIVSVMGSGKTVMSVYIIKLWFAFNLIKKVLIITKNEVIKKYKTELLNHIPDLKEKDIAIMGDNTDRNLFDKEAKIYICDYNQIKLIYYHYAGEKPKKGKRKMFKQLFPIDKDWGVFFDEIQAVKSIKSDVHKIVKNNTKNALAKIATSGTPVEKIEELFAIFQILNPKIIDMNYHWFMTSIAALDGDTYRILYYREKGVERVRKKIDPFMCTLKKSDIKLMVSKEIIDVEVEFTPKFKKEYERQINELMYDFSGGYIEKKSIAPLIQIIYNKLKVVTLDSPRFVKFDKLVSRIISSEKLIVWERSPDIIKQLSNYYEKKGIQNLYIDGSVDKYDRDKIISDFDNEEYKILFMSFLTTSEGWQIPSRGNCKRMIWYSLPDRVINYSQCNDRFYRLNSKAPVFIYRMILKGTIDEWAIALLEYKQKLKDGVIDKYEFSEIETESYAKYLGVNKKDII